jgi:hypothetical protein
MANAVLVVKVRAAKRRNVHARLRVLFVDLNVDANWSDAQIEEENL